MYITWLRSMDIVHCIFFVRQVKHKPAETFLCQSKAANFSLLLHSKPKCVISNDLICYTWGSMWATNMIITAVDLICWLMTTIDSHTMRTYDSDPQGL